MQQEKISHTINEVSFKLNLDLVKCACTLLVKHTYRVQNVSLFQNVKPKVIETETALREFPWKAIGGPVRSQNRLKLKEVSKVEPSNRLKTFF